MLLKSKPFFVVRKGFLLGVIFFLAIPGYLKADDGIDLGEVVVEAPKEKKDKPTLDQTSASTVLIPEDNKQAQTIPQLLEQSAGVTVKRYSGLDDFSALSLRGSSAGQVQIYLDEIPLLTAQGLLTDLSIIPMSAVQKVEVYRGGSPGILPESSVGGVVLLRSKAMPEKKDAAAELQLGSFETVKAKMHFAQPFKKFAPILAFEHARSKGDFTYKDDNGTRFNQADDQIVRRQNNDFASNSLFSKFVFDLPAQSTLSLTNIFFQKDEGVPGLGTRKSLNARLDTWRDLVCLNLKKKNLGLENLEGHLDLFFDYLNSQFNDPLAEISLSPQNTDDKTYRFGASARLSLQVGNHQSFKLFIAQRSEYYRPFNSLGPPQNGTNSSRQTISAGLEDEIILFSDRLRLVPSIRLENLYNKGNLAIKSDHQFSAKLGVLARLIDEFYFQGNVYRGFRNPTFTELFGDRGALQGNPNLLPEKAFNFDLGLSYDLPVFSWLEKAHVGATYFRHDVNRLIQFVQTSTFTAQAMNMNQALIQGGEFMATANFLKRLRLTTSYTYQQAKDTSNNPDTRGKYLPGRPQHEFYALISWDENWQSWLTSNLYTDLRYMSGNYLDLQNLLQVTNRVILGAGFGLTFIDKISARFTVQNILNDRISDLIGYPLPGRSYWGSIAIKI
ncbi:MAG: TonB-dependent receptor [Pseudomonadota bacterium]